VQTLHALALRMTGTSYAVAAEYNEKIDFSAVIHKATALLKKAERDDEDENSKEASLHRDRLLAGLRYLLIDEYQDIDADHYNLISAVAGRALHESSDKLALLAVGDDDQNIYAFNGANVRFIRQFKQDYGAQIKYLLDNYRSTKHIVDAATAVIAKSRERMKKDQSLRIDPARREQPPGGAFAKLDPFTKGRVHLLDVPPDPLTETNIALAELQRLNRLQADGAGHWGRFAVIAREWSHLEPFAMLCRQQAIPNRMLRNEHLPDLYKTREGFHLLRLLKGVTRSSKRHRVLLGPNVLSRWFKLRYRSSTESVIDHPVRALLASFIQECESAAPGAKRVVSDLIEALYEYRVEAQNLADRQNAPMSLLTAHRAKGLEFDHVLILDGGGWTKATDDERRLFYVAMTRARKTLTLCNQIGGGHRFVGDCADLTLRSRPGAPTTTNKVELRKIWFAALEHIDLSWPGRFGARDAIHASLRELDYGDSLTLRERKDGKPGWELVDAHQIIVGRMAKKFTPPQGECVAVRVRAIVVRSRKQGKNFVPLEVDEWELVLPEIEYIS